MRGSGDATRRQRTHPDGQVHLPLHDVRHGSSAPACAGPWPAPTPSSPCAAASSVAASRTSGNDEQKRRLTIISQSCRAPEPERPFDSVEPPCTAPYARWCRRRGAARLPPIPIPPLRVTRASFVPVALDDPDESSQRRSGWQFRLAGNRSAYKCFRRNELTGLPEICARG